MAVRVLSWVFALAVLGAGQEADPVNAAMKATYSGKQEEALKILEPLYDHPDKTLRARAWNGRAEVLQYMDKYEESIAARRKALAIWRQEPRGPRLGESMIWGNLGTLYDGMGRLDEARQALEEARRAAEDANDAGQSSQVLRQLGGVELRAGNLAEALRLREASIAPAEKAKNRDYLRSALIALGDAYRAIGDLERAEEAELRGVAESEGQPRFLVAAHWKLGAIYSSRGKYKDALRMFELSAKEAAELKSAAYEIASRADIASLHLVQGNPELALAQLEPVAKLQSGDSGAQAEFAQVWGMALMANNRHEEAVRWLSKAADAMKSRSIRLSEMHLRYTLGIALARQGDGAGAERELRAVVALRTGQDNVEYFLPALVELAGLQLDRKDLAGAGAAVAEALEALKSADQPPHLAAALTISGRIARAAGKTREAESSFRQAMDLVESLRQESTGGDAAAALFRQQWIEPYHELASMFMSAGRTRAALAVAESARARTLREAMRDGPDDLARYLTPGEQAEARRLRRAMATLQANKAPVSQLRQARLAWEGFLASARAAHPNFAGRLGITSAFNLTAFREEALEFLVTNSTVYWFRVSGGSVRGGRVAATPARMRELTEAFRGQLARRDPGFGETARQLHRLLMAPGGPLPESLIVAPDGFLWNLPFQALRDERGKYIVEATALSYAPSLASLADLRRRGRSLPGAWNGAPLVVADPGIAGAADSARKMGLGGGITAPAEPEVKRGLASATMVHFTVHGIVDQRMPLYSSLVLGGGGGEDGSLEAWEIAGLPTRAHLAVLAACETARGKEIAGEGLMGLSWGFFASGVPSVVASQWEVDSEATSQLFGEFYRQLGQTSRPSRLAQSLRAASLRLMASPEYRHPFYWAGFIAAGDPW